MSERAMLSVPSPQSVRAAVVEVAERAVRAAGDAVLGALVPHSGEPGRAVHYVPDDQTAEVCAFVTQLWEALQSTHDRRAATRLRVTIYCQVMEAELPAAVVWNLLRLAHGERPAWTFCTVGRHEKEIPADEPAKRFAEIERLSTLCGCNVGAVVSRLWQNRLRNAFLHSQYVTDDRGDFVGTKTVSPLTANAVRSADQPASGRNPYYYSDADVRALLESALEWLEAVRDVYHRYSEPYKDGRRHELPIGPVRWDASRAIWLPG